MVNFFYTSEKLPLNKKEAFEENCWVDMINPTDDEIEDIAAATGIGADMLTAALDDQERARAEFDDDNHMYIVDCPTIEESDSGDVYSTLPLALIYNNKCIVTVSLKGNPVLKDFITGRQKVYTEKPIHFTLNFMMGNAKRFLNVLTQIDRKSRRVQAELDRTMRNEEISQLLDLENSLVYISTSLNSNFTVQERLSKAEVIASREDYQDLYDDVVIESKQAIEMCNIYKDILTVTMDAYGSMISNMTNNTMRKLTIITILLAIPTMIAGFWGMNMTVPFQTSGSNTSTIWFWIVIAVTLLITAAIAVVLFKVGNNNVKKPKRQKRRKERDKK
ncbi:MAG: magnesium transporter CorA family protein [Clostridia bacterium]|nr:magnesium transporter CorA family protein [Clostridia bacterium]